MPVTSLVPEGNIWLVWAVILGMVAFAIIAEQKWKWGQLLSSAIVAIFGAMLLANLKVIPAKSPVYSTVSTYILPLSIPLLLFKCDIRKIIKESGTLFLIMNVAAVGSCLSALLCKYIFSATPGIQGIIAMQAGAYVGGTVNLVAMGKMYNMGPAYISAAAVVANVFVVLILLFYSFMTVSRWFRRNYAHPHIDAFESNAGADTGKSPSEQYWKPKPISLRNIAVTLATGMAITAVSQMICQMIQDTALADNAKLILGNVFLVMPTLTILLVALFPRYFNNLASSEEIGNLMIMLFFVTLGCAADVRLFLEVGPVFIITAVIILSCNMGVLLVVGKLRKWALEDIITASNATIGGPTTAAALAINKGWTALVVPGLLVGLYGYAVGNYCGVLVASLL